MVRAKKHKDLKYLADHTSVPVINARTEYSHPCEIMGDLQFIRRYRGSLEDLNVVFVSEVTNLCMSWFEASVKFPIQVTQIAPEGYQADMDIVKLMNNGALGRINISNDIELINEKTDLIYTDCWPHSDDVEMKEQIREKFLPFQISAKHLARLNDKSMFLPCPPVTRGQEVSVEAMNSKFCLNYQAKEFLLHSQNAILEMLNSIIS